MKKLLLMTFLLSMLVSVYSFDYSFSFTDKFVTDFVNNYKDTLKEKGIKDFQMDFVGNNGGKIDMTYKSIIPLKVEFSIDTVSKNHIKFYIHKFKALGFLPISKKTLINKITDAIEEMPEVKEYITIEFKERADDEEYSLDMRIQKNPVPSVPDLAIENAEIDGNFFSLHGNMKREGITD